MLKCGTALMKVEAIAYATPRKGMSLLELVKRMHELGNEVLDIDYLHNRIKVLHVIDEVER